MSTIGFLLLLIIGINGEVDMSGKSHFFYEENYELIDSQHNVGRIAIKLKYLKLRVKTLSIQFSNVSLTQEISVAISQIETELGIALNNSLSQIDSFRDFFSKFKSERTKKFDPLGQLWHDISGSPGPWEYRKELEMMDKIGKMISSSKISIENTESEVRILGLYSLINSQVYIKPL